MTPFDYHRPRTISDALQLLASHPDAALLGGGTCLLDLMKQNVEHPSHVIDLNFIDELAAVSQLPDGSLRIGGTARLAAVARREDIQRDWALLAECILVGLTPQLREAASFAGNITQRPRCIYFREAGFACNKKLPGSGCAAQSGVHFAHAVFGNSNASCIAVHPSDLCTGLTALDAKVEIANIDGTHRVLPITAFHRLPESDPTRETKLQRGDLITALIVPPQGTKAAAYIKGPEEGFAMASAAVRLALDGNTITFARVVLGGVAHKPWPCPAVEQALMGQALNASTFSLAADTALLGINTDYQTAFRATLLRAVLIESLERAASRIEVSV